MSIRSRYTSKRQPPARPVKTPKPTATDRVKSALKSFSGYMERNKKEYVRQTGDDRSIGGDLREIPYRVIRETGKLGREERERISERCRRDPDEEMFRQASGRLKKCDIEEPHDHLEFVVKPKPKPRKPKPKTIRMPYDPDAEVA